MKLKAKAITKIFLIFFSILPIFANKTTLMLNTNSHTSLIRDIIITEDKKEIITASDDKSVRVWDIESQKEVKKFLGEIGDGDEGKIFAIAKYKNILAVGGYLKNSEIRIYDYQTGEIKKLLYCNRGNVINDLAFSKDGKYLVSAENDEIRIWDVESWKRLKSFSKHSDDIYGVKIFKIDGEYRVVSVGLDKKVILYDLERKIGEYDCGFRLTSLAINEEFIVVSGESSEIIVFDRDLKRIKSIESNSDFVAGLALNKNHLIAGSMSEPFNIDIFSLKDNFGLISSFRGHNDLTMAVNFLDEKTAISAGGKNHTIYLWDIKKAKSKRRMLV